MARTRKQRPKLIIGEAFVKTLIETGVLPDNTCEVTIHAKVGDVVTLDYRTYGDERLVALAHGGITVARTKREAGVAL